jgi:hypothetical protein
MCGYHISIIAHIRNDIKIGKLKLITAGGIFFKFQKKIQKT